MHSQQNITRRNGNTTLPFNSNKCGELFSQNQPKFITTEEENDRALGILETLMNRSNGSPEDDKSYDFWVTLIAKIGKNIAVFDRRSASTSAKPTVTKQEMGNHEGELS